MDGGEVEGGDEVGSPSTIILEGTGGGGEAVGSTGCTTAAATTRSTTAAGWERR